MKVVRGKVARATKVDRCGKPLAGEKAMIVTDGFVRVRYTPNMEDGEDKVIKNANGDPCVVDRTAPSYKWWDIEAEFCEVDPELFGMATGQQQVLDYAQKAKGLRFSKKVPVDDGIALEVWSGTAGDDCDEPLDDSMLESEPIFSYGYWLAPAIVEGVISEIEISADAATFTLTGRAVSGPRWGRGPYEVVAEDADNTPGRLLDPIHKDDFIHVEEVTIAPPALTSGASALVLPTPYYAAVGTP